jgi:uncharacterized protein
MKIAEGTATPPSGVLSIELSGEQVQLLPDRAVVLPRRRTLIVADPHFGKDDLFRRAGIAVPRGPAVTDLQRLTSMLEAHGCERLVVLGDFLHAATRTGDSFLHAFALWRRAHSGVAIEVIAGNHDRRERREKWDGLVGWHASALVEPPFVFAHEPVAHPGGYVLAGHIHPVLRITARSHKLRVPVFWQRAEYLVLPSFGSFTGGANVSPQPADRLYAAGPERVIPLSARSYR